jgi:hypothetical protein
MFVYLKWCVVNDRQASEHEGKLDLFSHMLGLHDQYTCIPHCEQMSLYGIFLCMLFNMNIHYIKVIGPSEIAVSVEPFLRNFNSDFRCILNMELISHICVKGTFMVLDK